MPYNVNHLLSAVFKEATDTSWQLCSQNIDIRTLIPRNVQTKSATTTPINQLGTGKRRRRVESSINVLPLLFGVNNCSNPTGPTQPVKSKRKKKINTEVDICQFIKKKP